MKLVAIFRNGVDFGAGEISQGQFIVLEKLHITIQGKEQSEVEKIAAQQYPKYSRNNNLTSMDPLILSIWTPQSSI